MSDSQVFHFVPGSRFTCRSCGKCCSSNFEIPLQLGKAQLIKESGSYAERVRQGYQPLRVMADSLHFLGYDDDGKCRFLEANLCGLHKNEGLSHKPVICQLYPYNLVRAPDGIYVSLLYSCPSVVAGHGESTEKSAQALHHLFETHAHQVPMFGPVQDHILVTQFSTVTWRQYLKLEESLCHRLDPIDPIAYLVNAALLLAVPEPERAQFERRSANLLTVQNGPFQEFLSSVWCYLKDEQDEQTVPLLRPDRSAVRETLVRFLQNQFRGKLLIIGPSMVCRLLLLACAVGILLHELASDESTSLQEGFSLIEEHLVSQSNSIESALLEFEEFLLENLC